MAEASVRRARLSIDVAPELRRQLKMVAAAKDLSVREYVEAVLRQALAAEETLDESDSRAAWSRLSARSFARDWDSDADRAYDEASSICSRS